jgi:hypothetical protein
LIISQYMYSSSGKKRDISFIFFVTPHSRAAYSMVTDQEMVLPM